MTRSNDQPLVSVVIPTHDRPRLVQRAIRSVLAQVGVDLDIVVVDDGSDPAVPCHADPRVRVLRNQGARGVAAARNLGVEAATGDWVAFLDDDDLWGPRKLISQIHAAKSENRAWAVAGVVSVDAELHPLTGAPPSRVRVEDIRLRNVVPGGASNVVARADIVKQLRGFDTELRHLADWDVWIQLSEHGPPAVVADPQVAYVQHGANASLDVEEIAAEIPIIERRFGRQVDRAFVYRWIAWSQLRLGRRLAAAKWYVAAIRDGDTRSALRLAATLVAGSRAAMIANRAPTQWSALAEPWLADFRADPR